MRITIDDIHIDVAPQDANLVDVATRAKIGIPSPCYRDGRSDGCCQVCIVEVDGQQMYACCTRPTDGMQVVVNRSDLVELRKKRLDDYRNGVTAGSCACDCSCSSDCC